MTPAARKRALRREMAARRRALPAAGRARAHGLAAAHFLDRFVPDAPAGLAVAGYWPLADEFDGRALLSSLVARGQAVALPTVAGRGMPLVFRRWLPGLELKPAAFGVLEPPARAPQLVPGLLIVPLLAFDADGYRLGYGGGYYDATLSALRAGRDGVVAVGLAYAAQQVAQVPREAFDQPLDWVVTEAGVLPAGQQAATGAEGMDA